MSQTTSDVPQKCKRSVYLGREMPMPTTPPSPIIYLAHIVGVADAGDGGAETGGAASRFRISDTPYSSRNLDIIRSTQ